MQTTFLRDTEPPRVADVEIRQQGASEFLDSLPDGCASLIHADPPWSYARGAGGANPDQNGIYSTISMEEIAGHLRGAHRIGADGSRLLMWATWPKLMEGLSRSGTDCFSEEAIAWTPVSGGSWHKHNGRKLNFGVGFHWAGASEFALLYRKPGRTHRDTSIPLINAHESQITDHSEKPIRWLIQMVERWTAPGDLVVDLYAGLSPLARACAATKRRYLGCEVDPERATAARVRLARGMIAGLP